MPEQKPTNLWISPDGTPIRVILPDGRTCIIADKPRDIPPAFYRAALVAGAIPSTMKPEQFKAPEASPGDSTPFDREQVIIDAILKAKVEGTADAFLISGKPDIRWLREACGFHIDSDERDRVWGRVEREIADADLAEEVGGKDPDDA